MSARSLLPAALLFILAGCVATQKDVLGLSQQSDTMSAQMKDLKKVVSSLQANQADLNEKLDAIRGDMAALNDNLSDNRSGMSKLSSKLDDVQTIIAGKVASLDTKIAQTRDFVQEAEAQRRREAEEKKASEAEAAKLKAEEDARKAAEAAAKPQAADGQTPSQLYHQARLQFGQKQYDAAADGFALYLDKYPKGETADLALYYLGQSRYEQDNWKEAARQFAKVLDEHPKSEVTAATRLYYAMCLMKLKLHLDEAKRYLESIPEEFPRAPEAEKAKKLLSAWDKN